jgi:hypothetical protein
MTVHLFVGPTLTQAEIAALCDFVCLPPVAQGDVLRSVKARPRAIGIVDGYFDGVPAVWHKEILWAMTQGIHVFGSASMGALRAAELHPFGMRGVGRIFEAYRSGEIEDDDEVAVLHGPAETGYVSLSEPLVNIRATLEQAERAGMVSRDTRAAMSELAKGLFYQERSWERVLAPGGAAASTEEIRRLREWLPTGRVDQKRLDAHAMINAMQEFLAADPGQLRPRFKFEWTDMWDIATASMVSRGVGGGDAGSGSQDDWVLDELRLDEASFESVRQRAMLRRLAVNGGRSRRRPIDSAARQAAEQRLRMRLGLFRRSDVDRWCAESGIDPDDLARLIDDEARVVELESKLEAELRPDLLDQLRLDGDYARFVARARDKQAILSARGQEDADPAAGPTSIALVAWHFEARLGRAIPDDLDSYVRRLGFKGRADFYRALARERLYLQIGKVEADR